LKENRIRNQVELLKLPYGLGRELKLSKI